MVEGETMRTASASSNVERTRRKREFSLEQRVDSPLRSEGGGDIEKHREVFVIDEEIDVWRSCDWNCPRVGVYCWFSIGPKSETTDNPLDNHENHQSH